MKQNRLEYLAELNKNLSVPDVDICKYNLDCSIRALIKRKKYCSEKESHECRIYQFYEKWKYYDINKI